jgi:outer membrane protein assembly factor BamE (lipoprotein component of BamABCDE complex)
MQPTSYKLDKKRPDNGSSLTSFSRGAPWAGLGLALAALLLATGCSEQVLKHGQQFSQGDLQQIQPGMIRDQVRLTLGTPSTTTTASATGGDIYYYISSIATQAAFFKPTEVDRQVVAVYFNPLGTVERVANYGIKDGKVFDFISRTTPAPGGNEDGLLKQLFRNLGTKQIFGDG